MSAILTVAFPVFALVLFGWIAGRRRLLGLGASAALNGFVVWVALPALMFHLMATAKLQEILNVPFILIYGGAGIATFVVGMIMNRMASRGGLADMALHGIAASWGNVGYMGIPLCLAAFGPAGLLPATLSTMIGAITFLAGAVVLVEIGVHANHGAIGALWRAVSAVARNPLVIAVLGGIAWSASGLALPEPISKLLQLAGAAAAPCALFAIGVFIADQKIGDALGEVGLAAIGKLILQPLIVIALLPLFPGLDPVWAKSAILLAALPSASNAFIIANQYGRWVPEASASVLLTTALSMVSVSLLLVALDIG